MPCAFAQACCSVATAAAWSPAVCRRLRCGEVGGDVAAEVRVLHRRGDAREDLVDLGERDAVAAAAHDARGPLDPAQDVLEEERVRPRGIRVAGALVPGASALEVLAPGDRVVGAHRTAARVVRRLVEGDQDVDVLTRVGREVVPLVEAHPLGRQHLGGRVARALEAHRGGLLRGVVAEARSAAGELAVPRDGVHRVGRGVQSDVPSAVVDVALERRELGIVQQPGPVGIEVVRRVDGRREDDRRVLREISRRRERGRREREARLAGVPDVDTEPVLLSELDDGEGRVVDVRVAEPEGLTHHEHLVLVGALGSALGEGRCCAEPQGGGDADGADPGHHATDALLHWSFSPSSWTLRKPPATPW